MEYQDFELELMTGPNGLHRVNVLSTPAGETRQEIVFTLNDARLREELAQLEQTVGYQANLSAAQKRERLAAVRQFGRTLFDALINDNLKALYDNSRYIAQQRGQGVRLKLRIHSPLLAAVPWELLYDPRLGEFVSTSRQVSVVRYVALPRPVQLLATRPPLNVLGLLAAPTDLPPVAAGQKAQIEAALKPLLDKGLASLTWLEGANWRGLLRAMHRGPWHVLHYVGHSGFDHEADEGYLSLVGEQGQAERLSADQLGTLLADHGSLRLVLLNSDQGGRMGQDMFAGIATTLVRRGIPAVIGMQYEISDAAALEFALTFYEMLAENLPIETALAETRKAISLAIDESVAWGTPVFYTHAPDSVLFDKPVSLLADPVNAAMVPDTPSSDSWVVAHELIVAHFNISELQTLCFSLGIDHESWGRIGKVDMVRELIRYCQRHGRLLELRDELVRQRPRVSWP